MLICELCGQRISGEAYQLRLRGSLTMVCKNCFVSSSKVRDKGTTPVRTSTLGRIQKSRVQNTIVKVEDRLKPIPDLGKIIMERRRSLGMSIKDLSVKVGIRESLIKKVENGKIALPIQDLKKLERVLSVSLTTVSEDEKFYKANLKNIGSKDNKSLTLGDLLTGG